MRPPAINCNTGNYYYLDSNIPGNLHRTAPTAVAACCTPDGTVALHHPAGTAASPPPCSSTLAHDAFRRN